MEQIKSHIGLTIFQLKVIALTAMLVDHAGRILAEQVWWTNAVGRIAFPIFCFVLVEGFCHTGDIRKYMGRLFVFAVVSEIPFDLMTSGTWFFWRWQNTFFTLFLGLLMLYLYVSAPTNIEKVIRVVGCMLAADYLFVDYQSGGLILILCFYIFREKKGWQAVSAALTMMLINTMNRMAGVLALIPIFLYNGKRGLKMQFLFYVLYPVSCLIFGLIRIHVIG